MVIQVVPLLNRKLSIHFEVSPILGGAVRRRCGVVTFFGWLVGEVQMDVAVTVLFPTFTIKTAMTSWWRVPF